MVPCRRSLCNGFVFLILILLGELDGGGQEKVEEVDLEFCQRGCGSGAEVGAEDCHTSFSKAWLPSCYTHGQLIAIPVLLLG